MGLSFTIAAGPRQRSHSRVRIPRDTRPRFTVSDSRFPQLGGPDPSICIPQEKGWPSYTPRHWVRHSSDNPSIDPLLCILWRIDPLLGNARNAHAANSTGAVFSLCLRTDLCYATRAQLARARWRHTTVCSDHVICVFCDARWRHTRVGGDHVTCVFCDTRPRAATM
jgi:hypothetical protein